MARKRCSPGEIIGKFGLTHRGSPSLTIGSDYLDGSGHGDIHFMQSEMRRLATVRGRLDNIRRDKGERGRPDHRLIALIGAILLDEARRYCRRPEISRDAEGRIVFFRPDFDIG